MRSPTVVGAVAVLGLGLLVPAATAAAEPAPAGRQGEYAAAAAEYGVPETVLLGVSYLESRWDTNAGTPSTSGGYGPMHLTDAASLAAETAALVEPVEEDARGDYSRPAKAPAHPGRPDVPAPEAMQTLDTAAALTGVPKDELKRNAAANLRGGAALLASYQQALGAPRSADPAAWYGAVARYSGASDAEAAQQFADDVYAIIQSGQSRTTDDGSSVTLTATATQPQRHWLDRLGLPWLPRPDGIECPLRLSCEWIPAPYQALPDNDYGNHDLSDRPARQKVEYIVIHDTEGSYATTLRLVQDPAYVSWHYTLRSADGHIAQHVKTKDVAWHAGNWYVNAKAVGLEHEGFAALGTWYTEAMYRTSSRLVRYLALRHGVPLDRHHIIGHDNVQGTTPATVRGMHWDPGPYWDWNHYMNLLGAPLRTTGTPRSGLVTIAPDFDTNRPAFLGCTTGQPTTPCPSKGSSSVVLRTEPRDDAPLVTDVHRPPSTMHVSDHSARAATGQQYAVAERAGAWTAIWYLGQKAWLPTTHVKWATGFVAVPRGETAPVYGRAYPEAEAYPAGVPVQALLPLNYVLASGQRYAVGHLLRSEYYRATTFDGSSPGDWTVIRGNTWYAQIQVGHRIGYVMLSDVWLLPSFLGAP